MRRELEIDELREIQARFRRIFVLMALLAISLAVLIIIRVKSPNPPSLAEKSMMWATVFVATLMVFAHYISLRRTARESRDRLEQLTFLDALTGAYNHRYLDMALASEVKRARRHNRPLAIAYIDLDKFKPVNDNYGHSVGNRVLADLGRLFLACVRESDIVGRVGGDEFVVLLPETDLSGARIFADRIRERVAKYCLQLSPEVRIDQVRCSIGVAEFPGGETSAEAFLSIADEAMYRAKRAGGDRVCA